MQHLVLRIRLATPLGAYQGESKLTLIVAATPRGHGFRRGAAACLPTHSPARSNNSRSPGSHKPTRVRYSASLSSSPTGSPSSNIHHAHGRVPGAPRKNNHGNPSKSELHCAEIQNCKRPSRSFAQSWRIQPLITASKSLPTTPSP